MVRILLASVLVMVTSQPLWALGTDFEDLVLSTSYSAGNVINSGDLSFQVVNFPDTVTGANVVVTNGNEAGGGGLELNLVRSIGLDFQLPGEVQGVSFLFADFFSVSSGLVINGTESATGSGLPPLDGTTIAGVSISVTGMAVTGGVQGQVTLVGPIQSLIVGGTEFFIDDVLVTVPEPGSFVLALVSLAWLGTFVRRRRRAAPG